ncbi:differentially expressed in FDCP 6 homolog [Denticeps clupeoides]|uniref:PH domain-containing protein n=1 Tax=Denticeps clupeoides TaxID=299321 RepID=A0AAY4C8A5_9TELE|nr:differentially expressed in FDCP 6 homolog [Denticeps clupeoides]
MELRAELLKSIWHAFTSLDVGDSGKVSKSQLKVLSHNLFTALNITHDSQTLESHFRDDDDGPVSSQGYMPYLNKYILDKAVQGTFNKENVDMLCWTLSSKKNYHPERHGSSALSKEDAFRLWCLFNFLSEDRYPLVLVPEEVEYLLKKICSAMSVEPNLVDLEDYISHNSMQSGVMVWSFLDVMNSGILMRGVDRESITMAIEEVYLEIVGNTLKEGYLWKKGHLRRNWTERWFSLRLSTLSYYTSEDRKECKGIIELDQNCCVEVLADKEGKRCMLCVKTLSKTYEMSAPDTKQRQEWTTAIQTAIRLRVEGKTSLHRELKLRRREQREERERRRALKEEELQRLRQVQQEREQHLAELELLHEAQRQAQISLEQEEEKRRRHHQQLQKALQEQLREAEEARASMAAEMVVKEAEAERQRRRIQELEDMQRHMEEALLLEIKARKDEEACRYAQARLLAEEEEKMKALLALQEEQEEFILRTQREKQELRQEMASKTQALEEAQQQLEEVRASRHRVDQDIAAAQRKLRQASTSVKHWNVQMNRLMHPIGPGDRRTSLGNISFPTGRSSSVKEGGQCPSPKQGEVNRQNSWSGQGHAGHADGDRPQEDEGRSTQAPNGNMESL